jgi:hypothetical protein
MWSRLSSDLETPWTDSADETDADEELETELEIAWISLGWQQLLGWTSISLGAQQLSTPSVPQQFPPSGEQSVVVTFSASVGTFGSW